VTAYFNRAVARTPASRAVPGHLTILSLILPPAGLVSAIYCRLIGIDRIRRRFLSVRSQRSFSGDRPFVVRYRGPPPNLFLFRFCCTMVPFKHYRYAARLQPAAFPYRSPAHFQRNLFAQPLFSRTRLDPLLCQDLSAFCARPWWRR